METGNLNRLILRAGASVMAALMLTTTAFAQDTGDGVQVIEPVHYGIAVGEPDPNDGVPDIVIDDGDFVPGDPGDDDTGDDDWGDDGTDDDWVDDGTDDDWVDDGSGDDGVDDGTDDGDGMVWAGGDPNFCEACGGEVILDSPIQHTSLLDTPVAVLQMSAETVLTAQPPEVAAKPRTSSARSTPTNRVATCLALHPQIPWLCE